MPLGGRGGKLDSAGGGGVGGEGLGEFMEVAGAAVVAEAFPCFKDGVERGVGEGMEIGKAVQPCVEKGDDRLYLGLLEHELGDDGLVDGGLGAPWQRALAGGEPLQERLTKIG